MRDALQVVGWLACVVYSTIPAFWLMIHPFADRWRARRSPYALLVPAWMTMWLAMALITEPWRRVVLYRALWTWLLAVLLFALGFYIYSRSGKNFSAKQLGGLPEVQGRNREQRLVTDGIRARVRHPVYLAHLCEMLAWSIGTGLAVCWGLTAFAIVTGVVMIRMEDRELEHRFQEEFRSYRQTVPAVLPSAGRAPLFIVLTTAIALVIVTSGFLIFAIARQNQPMLFQHGTLEVPESTAFAIMNPFRSHVSEQTAERLIRDLRTSECEHIVQSLNSEIRMCPTLRGNRQSRLIWREDGDSTQVLVYDLPDVQSRLWITVHRHESGFEVDRISLIR
jgi:protein-S-isoprenylcysteine O-methyltransferase Ste14